MISGLCQICRKAGVLNTCSLCGRMVCASHFDKVKGVCVACLGGKRA